MKNKRLILIVIFSLLLLNYLAFRFTYFETFQEAFTGRYANPQYLPEQPPDPGDQGGEDLECSDGTPAGTCVSGDRPLYCSHTFPYQIINNCDFCGCPSSSPNCLQDGTCGPSPLFSIPDNFDDEHPSYQGTIGGEKVSENQSNFSLPVQEIQTIILNQKDCSDGTKNGECSLNTPYICIEGNLIDDCFSCGCNPLGNICDLASGSCVSDIPENRENSFFEFINFDKSEILVAKILNPILPRVKMLQNPLDKLYSPSFEEQLSPPRPTVRVVDDTIDIVLRNTTLNLAIVQGKPRLSIKV